VGISKRNQLFKLKLAMAWTRWMSTTVDRWPGMNPREFGTVAGTGGVDPTG
jgi:hypothetical protein